MDWPTGLLLLLPVVHVQAPPRIAETVTVSAPAGRLRISTPGSATVLDAEAVASAAALTIDDVLKTVPGFSLFRRSSSRVANPTTQGVTLRGLSASGASRTVVVADDVALNDPVGGWVYWNRVPAAAIERIEVTRGAVGDVYGSDAMGGAIRIETSSRGARA
ncbi:MAG: Plug domain-containing protein [Acidobacteria bacterium]|nr:Plug domain-containing protein [Acidobacteriota bacterium]